MTLILALPARNGVVLASDGQLTAGAVRSPAHKLFQLNPRCAWAAAGEVALIQRVAERLQGSSMDQPLGGLRDDLASIVKECVTRLLQTDFRTPFCHDNPEVLLSLHPGDFVFVEWSGGPRILHVASRGTAEWIEGRPFATGSGDLFAYALLRKYHGSELDVEQAKLLAVKVIEEAIEVGAYGLGPPIAVWSLGEGGLSRCDEDEMAGLADSAGLLRELEVRLLVERHYLAKLAQQQVEPVV